VVWVSGFLFIPPNARADKQKEGTMHRPHHLKTEAELFSVLFFAGAGLVLITFLLAMSR